MHIYFSGIGGTAIGPLALIAKQAGYTVSGSDKQASQYIDYLRHHGITDIHIGQSAEQIAKVHAAHPIDWYVYSSAVIIENPHAPELMYCHEQDIKASKRDDFLNYILQEKGLQLIAIAGTHGKTTTTAMVIWLLQQCGISESHSVGAKFSFGDMGHYEPQSQYFVYEADEFDRNFLAFEPHLSVLSGVSWDHHEIFLTRGDYQAAFRDFISQSGATVLWEEDALYLQVDTANPHLYIADSSDRLIATITLLGQYNRLDGWLAIQAVHRLTKTPVAKLIEHINRFPGVQRRMEQLVPNLYSDYAHTPDKIRGCMSVALELASQQRRSVVVIYEPLTNRRQKYMINDYTDCFNGADRVYWLPSYLAREDPLLRIIPPEELISHLADPSIADPSELGERLKQAIQRHLASGDIVVGMAGGGGGSLDEWLRQQFPIKNHTSSKN